MTETIHNRNLHLIKRNIKKEQELIENDENHQRKIEEKKAKAKAEATKLEKYADEGLNRTHRGS